MKKLFVIALAAVAMVACVNDELIETPQGNEISFDNAFIDNATRAELKADNLNAFKVWGYIDAGTKVSLFNGTEVTKTSDDWTYAGGARYWAPGRQHYFQAIAPLTPAVVAESTTEGVVSAINYTVDGESDLIYAAANQEGKVTGNSAVAFTFDHLLSKVEFKFNNGFAQEDGIEIAVRNVKMTVPAEGTYDVANEAWAVAPTVAGTTLAFAAVDAWAAAGTDLKFGPKFVLPYNSSYAYAIEFDVVVKYKNTEINTVSKTSSVMVALEKGTAYNFIATINAENLNMESIDFEVGRVEGWIPGGDSTFDTAYVSTTDALQVALNTPGVDTIVLTEDVTLTEGLTVEAISRTRSAVEPVAVTLDLNGKTIAGEVARDKAVIKVANGAALIVMNGTIKSVAANGGSALLNEGLLTLCENVIVVGAENGTDGNSAAYAVNAKGAGSKLVVNGANISGRGAIGATLGANVELNGGIYHTPKANWGHAVYADGQGTEVVINNGTFSEGYEYANNIWGQYQIYSSNSAKVTVKGGDFSQTWDCANGYDLNTASDGVIEISGGIFADDPSKQNGKDYVAEGYTVLKNAEGKYEIITVPGVKTLDALVAQLALTDKVNVTEPIVIAEGETVELNLAGKTITANLHKSVGAVLKNQGTLTITGGTISSTADNGGSAIMNEGTLTVTDATLNGAPNAGGSWPSYSVNNVGIMTLNNCKITSYHGAVCSYGAGAELTLNDCEIDMRGIPGFTSHGMYTYDGGKVVVNGGTYVNHATDQNASGASVINGAVEVNAGTFSGRIENYYGTPVLKGGVYSVKPRANFVAAGYAVIEKDGKFEVEKAVSNVDELKAAVAAGETSIWMKDGTYDTKDFQFVNKTLTLKGAENGVKIFISQNNDVACTSLDMCTVTFENLTIETLGGIYKGFARMAGTYKNCTIVNNYFTFYGKHVFEGCTFNATKAGNEHCVWTYGAAEVEFVNCKFNYSDRCVNVYVDNGANTPGITQAVKFTECKFNTTNAASQGAVEVNSTPFTAGVTVTLNDCDAPAYGEMVYVSPWDGTKGKTATITVDGELKSIQGFGIVNGYYVLGNTVTVLNGEGFKTVATTILADSKANVVVELANDIDLAGIEWPAVCATATFTLDGKGNTIRNLTTSAVEEHGFSSTAMFTTTRKATTIKNLVVENATVTGNGKDNSHGAVLVACNYADLTIKDVNVVDSTISNCDRTGGLLTYLYFKEAVVENCVVDGCTINSIGTAGAILGMNNSNNFTMTNCNVVDTTVSSSEGSNKAGILIGTWQNAGTLTSSGNTHENSKAINAGVETNNEIGRHA